MRAGAGGLVGLVARHAFLIVICLAALYPLWFIVTTALKTNADYQLDPTGFPAHPTLDSLRTMVSDEPLPRWMWNSLLVTVSSVAVSTLVALLAAYAAVFGRFRGHRIFLSTSVALMVVPPVTLLVPMFVFMPRVVRVGGAVLGEQPAHLAIDVLGHGAGAAERDAFVERAAYGIEAAHCLPVGRPDEDCVRCVGPRAADPGRRVG